MKNMKPPYPEELKDQGPTTRPTDEDEFEEPEPVIKPTGNNLPEE